MHIEQAQFPAALHRDTRDRIAAVKVDQLHHALINRQTAAFRAADPVPAASFDSGQRFAVRLQKRIKQKGRIIVHRKHRTVRRHRLCDQRRHIHLMAAGGGQIHLLEKGKIRRAFGNQAERAEGIFPHSVGAARHRLRAAVHKEAEIRAVRAEADIEGGDGIDLVNMRRRFDRPDRFQRLMVLNAMIGQKHIGDIAQNHQQHNAQNRSYSYDDTLCDFAHAVLPLPFLRALSPYYKALRQDMQQRPQKFFPPRAWLQRFGKCCIMISVYTGCTDTKGEGSV